jgi:hypothetical protein
MTEAVVDNCTTLHGKYLRPTAAESGKCAGGSALGTEIVLRDPSAFDTIRPLQLVDADGSFVPLPPELELGRRHVAH